jgi:hypothetical protein
MMGHHLSISALWNAPRASGVCCSGVDGIRSGRGYSGSTHWNNAARSRWIFTTPVGEDGKEKDPDLRLLELAKANRARRGQKIELPGVSTGANDLHAEQSFLELLDKLGAQGRRVTNTTGQDVRAGLLR